MSKTASRVVAGDGSTAHLTSEQIVKYGLAQGVIAAKDEAAWNVYAERHPGDALTAVTRRITAARAVSPATPVAARSGASAAPGTGVPAVTYPRTWGLAVSAAQRIRGSRKVRQARAAWPTVAPGVRAADTAPTSSGSGYYDKSVKPSAQAAAQEDARQADLRRMAAEQAARFSA